MNFLDKVPLDKSHHFIAGALVGDVVACGFVYWVKMPQFAGLGAVLAALAAGILKELADYIANEAAKKAGQPPPHGVEMMDIIATVLGGVSVALPLF